MKAARNHTDRRGENRVSEALSADGIRQRVEDYVREEPFKAIGQAAAAGFILRFLPLRSIFMTGVRLAAPLMLLNRIWAYTSKDGGGSGTEEPSNRPESREKTTAR